MTEVFTDAGPGSGQAGWSCWSRRAGPLAVLVDDAEALHQTPVAELLAQIPAEGRGPRPRAGDRGDLRASCCASCEASPPRPASSAAGCCSRRRQAQLGQELFGTKLPRSAAFDRPAGRGYLIQAGQATLVQVPGCLAEPPASASVSDALDEVPDRLPVIDDGLHRIAHAGATTPAHDHGADGGDDGRPARSDPSSRCAKAPQALDSHRGDVASVLLEAGARAPRCLASCTTVSLCSPGKDAGARCQHVSHVASPCPPRRHSGPRPRARIRQLTAHRAVPSRR